MVFCSLEKSEIEFLVLEPECGSQRFHVSPGTSNKILFQFLLLASFIQHWLCHPSAVLDSLDSRHCFSSQGDWQRSYNLFPERVIKMWRAQRVIPWVSRLPSSHGFDHFLSFCVSDLHALLMAPSTGEFFRERFHPDFWKRLFAALQSIVMFRLFPVVSLRHCCILKSFHWKHRSK